MTEQGGNGARFGAIVTGAAGGMGRAVARELSAGGAAVALLDRKAAPEDLGAREHFYCGDLTDEAFVADAVRDAAQRMGRIDWLVHTAGVLWFDRDRSLLDIDMEVWSRVFQINVEAAVRLTRMVVPHMKRAGGGAMVFVSSTQAMRGDDRPQDAYQASKAAILAVSKSLAIQLARDGIRSNVLVPGPTATPMQARWDTDPQGRQAVQNVIPLGRVGTPQDMAHACAFLLSDRASFITGTELVVDGGLLARP